MQLLLIRHAEALDVGDDPPLSDHGRRVMGHSARRLRLLQKRLDGIICSTRTRARQSADILRASYGKVPVLALPALDSDTDLPAVVGWLATQERDAAVAVVGHEPALGRLLGLLTCGRSNRVMGFKKSGACLLRGTGAMVPGSCMLVWAMTPAQLRALKP